MIPSLPSFDKDGKLITMDDIIRKHLEDEIIKPGIEYQYRLEKKTYIDGSYRIGWRAKILSMPGWMLVYNKDCLTKWGARKFVKDYMKRGGPPRMRHYEAIPSHGTLTNDS